MYPKSDWIDVAQLLNWMDGMDHRAGWGIEHLTELKKVQWLLIHFKTFLFNCILSQDLCVHFCLVASCEYFMFGCIFILRDFCVGCIFILGDFCVGCIFTGDLLCWLHLHWRFVVLVASSLEIGGLCHVPPFTTDCPAWLCPRIILRILYTPCVRIVCTYIYTLYMYCVYIRTAWAAFCWKDCAYV